MVNERGCFPTEETSSFLLRVLFVGKNFLYGIHPFQGVGNDTERRLFGVGLFFGLFLQDFDAFEQRYFVVTFRQ